jgi:hypothetical protein
MKPNTAVTHPYMYPRIYNPGEKSTNSTLARKRSGMRRRRRGREMRWMSQEM